MRAEGWRDLWTEAPAIDAESPRQQWTWRRGANSARFDRCYAWACGSDSVECIRMEAIKCIWPALTDHVALRVVLGCRRRPRAGARADLDRGAEHHAPAPSGSAKPPGSIRQGRGSSHRQRENVPVVKVANVISEIDTHFRERASLCLAHAGDATWTPENETLTDADHVVPWTCLPAHGGFKVARGGNRGEQRVTCDAEKVAQSHVFGKFKKWAAEACGVTEAELRGS